MDNNEKEKSTLELAAQTTGIMFLFVFGAILAGIILMIASLIINIIFDINSGTVLD